MAVSGTNTGVFDFTASNDALATIIIMDSCRWVGAGAAGDNLLVTDAAGNLIFKSKADGPNFVDGWVFDYKWVNGVTISSMNSGSFQVYEARR